MAILPSADSRSVAVRYKRTYVHRVLVNRLVKLAQEKRCSYVNCRPNMTIAVDRDVKKQTKQTKIVSEYDQEIPQSQTADNPVAPRGRAAQPSRDTRKTN